jgi:ribosomal protein L11 methyltransferase
MDYTELRIELPGNGEERAILMAELEELGFESFSEDEESLSAYISTAAFTDHIKSQLDSIIQKSGVEKFNFNYIPYQNWNAIWESNYQPVLISGKCYIRAPFHLARPEVPFEIIIEPKMAFGTAHHETTAMMVEMMLGMQFEGKSVLDMGSGTGVLAILANKSGAYSVTAIDNDEWAYRNSIENFGLNGMETREVFLGDASKISGRKFDIILANINRNILLNDMYAYSSALNEKGMLLMSGFYVADSEKINGNATSLGMELRGRLEKNKWACMLFTKE